MKRPVLALIALLTLSSALVTSAEWIYKSSRVYSSTGSLSITNSYSTTNDAAPMRPSAISVTFNTPYAATVTVSRVRGTSTNILATYEGSTAISSVGFRQADLLGYAFIKNDVLLVADDSNSGTNSIVTVDLEKEKK